MIWRKIPKPVRVITWIIASLASFVLLLRVRAMFTREPEAALILLLIAILLTPFLASQTIKKLAMQHGSLSDPADVPESHLHSAERSFASAKTRYGMYWLLLSFLFILLYLPLDEENVTKYSEPDSPIRTSQVRYFGNWHTYDGVEFFEYKRPLYQLLFYTIWGLPIIAALICGTLIYHRLHDWEVALWLRRPDRHANLLGGFGPSDEFRF